VSGGYSVDRRFSSFVGFAPAEAPRVAIGVFIDEPKGSVYGGEVAAPAFREIAEHAMKTLGVPPSRPLAEAPPPPEPAAPAVEGPTPVAEADRSDPAAGTGTAVPSLAGLPARAAIRRLEEADLEAELDGSGKVVAQTPAAGKVVSPGTRVRVRLAPVG
jgi:cell division protein FtsI (penicillin-binding protein 3)